MSSVEGQNASTSLPAGSGAATVTGSVADCGAIYLNTVAVVTATAALSAGAIEIEGSLDNINWYPVRTSIPFGDFTVAGVKVYANVVPCRYIRSRISTILVGGTISAVVGAAGA